MRRQTLRFAPCILVLLLFVPLAFPKSYQAFRYDVDLQVNVGGDLLVTETVDFRFKGGPFTYVFREVPVKESDGLDQFQAFMDGQELRIGAGEMPGLELEQKSGAVRVTWHFPPTSDTSRTFVFKYRARHAVRRADRRDMLLWNALPPNHDYRIESSRISVICPPGIQPAGEPGSNRNATVHNSGQVITYQTGDLGRNHGFAVRVPFALGSILTEPPRWQQESELWNAEVLHAIIIASAVEVPLLLIGILLIVRLRNSKSFRRAVGPTVITTPPDDLPPALVGAVRGSWSDWRVAVATLIHLAERGFLEIEAQPKRWWTGREFTLRRKADPGKLSRYEQVLLRLIFETDQPYSGEIGMRKAQRRLMRRWRQLTRTLHEEARAAGFIDPDRDRRRNRWVAVGVTIMLLALGVTAASLLMTVPQRSPQPVVIAVAVSLAFISLGLLVAILGTTLTPLTDAALDRKQGWDAFRKYLKDVSSHKIQLQPEWLASYLRYAIVLGLGNQWAKAYKDRGMPAEFAWLVGADQFDGSQVAALVAVLHSSGAGSSSPGGAGAGAGGGGGASGAG